MPEQIENEPDGRTWSQVLADAGGPAPITTDPDELAQLFTLGVMLWSEDGLQLHPEYLPESVDDDLDRQIVALRDSNEFRRAPAVAELCRRLAAQGVPRAEMPWLLGVSEQEVALRFAPPEIDEAIEMIRAGVPRGQVARHFGVVSETITRWCDKYGIPRVSQPKCDPELVAELTEMIEGGLSPTAAHRYMVQFHGDVPGMPSRSYAIKINQRLAGAA